MYLKSFGQPQIDIYVQIRSQRRLKSTSTRSNLLKTLKLTFKTENEVLYNTNLPITAKSTETFDIYFPNLKLAFKFQDRDNFKFEQKPVKSRGIVQYKELTFVHVPYWWDSNRARLIATIREKRPDLLTEYANLSSAPIPQEPPVFVNQRLKKYVIPGRRELTQATFYTDNLDPTNWMLFEKYDGIRAMWNPQDKTFVSRGGNKLRVPNEVIDSMPSHFLDGEFWFGRGNFSEAIKISSRTDLRLIDWQKFKYMVFDQPTEHELTFEERYKYLQQAIPVNHPYVVLAPVQICKGKDHLQEFTSEVVNNGGEGIILRKPDALYKEGRSSDYIKFKVYRDDEARIVQQIDSKTYKCELPSGIFFEAPAGQELLKVKEPMTGDIVTFKYTKNNLKTGQPAGAILHRFREDMTWEDVKANFKSHKKANRNTLLPNKVKRVVEKGYWSDLENRVKFFNQLASLNDFDPSIPENWYQITLNDVLAQKGGRAILHHYNGSLSLALIDAYPNIGLDSIKLKKGKDTWSDPRNLQNFFKEFAEENNFDPQDSTAWSIMPVSKIRLKKGGSGVLHRYKSIKNALEIAYPEIDWSPLKQKGDNQITPREFFVQFAKHYGFDPLDQSNWFYISARQISIFKGMYKRIAQVGKRWTSLLVDAFPEVEFDTTKFEEHGYWSHSEHSREFFDNFARDHNFDSLIPDNWYTVKKEQVEATKAGQSLLRYHHGNLRNAILYSYPDLSFSNKFTPFNVTDEYCKTFFDRIAEERGMNSNDVDQWYRLSTSEISARSSGSSILDRYKSIGKALMVAYPNLDIDVDKFRKVGRVIKQIS